MSRKKTILTVDDTPSNLSLITGLLRDTYRTKVATSGVKALEIIGSGDPPDLVLLDIMMPGMDGYEVCRRMKTEQSGRDIPVIFLTAMTQSDSEQKGLELGAVDYITKPISPPILLARVQTHLRLKEANDLLRDHARVLEALVAERTRELSETNRALSRFVPQATLQALGKEGIHEVRLGDHVYGDMTIMFTDIRSYTTLSETMTPGELFDFTNDYHNRMTPIIRQHAGVVQQFQGDGVMSVFPRSADDGVMAAIELQRAVSRYNEESRSGARGLLRVGIGLHTGPLMMGIIGDDERWEPTITSDAVNSAARIENLTKYYDVSVVVSEATFNALRDPERYHHRFLDSVMVEGKLQPLSIHEVFDADPQDLLERKASTASILKQGQGLYFEGNFVEAVKRFAEILKVLPDDTITKHYLKRSSQYLLDGAPRSFQHVHIMKHEQTER